MELVTMREDLDLPGGPSPAVTVEIYPAGEKGARLPVAYYTADDGTRTIVAARVLSARAGDVDEHGAYEIDLPPQSACQPAGLVWGVRITGPGVTPRARFFTVPDGPGPHLIVDHLTDPPGALIPPHVAAALEQLRAELLGELEELKTAAVTYIPEED